jgi:hypothetical protein
MTTATDRNSDIGPSIVSHRIEHRGDHRRAPFRSLRRP